MALSSKEAKVGRVVIFITLKFPYFEMFLFF